MVVVKISGPTAKKLFAGESGGIRWQRVPPTEKKDRVHTSTITVAVLPEPKSIEVNIKPEDVSEVFTRGSGPGGQHRNKVATAVQMTHIPTGIMVRAESEKSQKQNRENAMVILKAKLYQIQKDQNNAEKRKFSRSIPTVASFQNGQEAIFLLFFSSM